MNMRRALACLVVIPVCQPVMAESSALVTPGYVVQVLLSLLLVCALLFGLGWLLKRVNALTPGGGSQLRVMSSLKVGAREKLVVVRSDDQVLLLGVTAGGISTLHRYPADSSEAEFAQVLDAQESR